VEYCTGLPAEGVQAEAMIDLFITVQWNRVMEWDSEAKEVLAKFQADILGHRNRQINPVVEYYREAASEEESDADSHSERDLNEEDGDTSDEWDPESDVGSASYRKEGEDRNWSEYQVSLCFHSFSIIRYRT
jgi:hypothetical protein